ncbi:DUF4760 domain-containing protein [Frankia sp. AgB1.9]|uniref:DUF4760 domain-containing protein n=1 Tax=unclassified Frankia TaxID=2632575 RepID=UPI001934AC30|nr:MULTISPECIES: DUF4760 domain-containing protein [unclassified Frankia]MBL7489316.1 DUF4760 domain-containing protein [Frankia sp. AgW1.1]MBL7553098.1 DUF4760 domain-containing protein [Frankia sp. AgB1.9]MBL7623083.1 DUF4760 domain-containing protein [Frankia sp. AgB1.8]
MDTASIAFNIAALSASIAALIVSTLAANRQTKAADGANRIPFLLEVFGKFSSGDFIDDLLYVEFTLVHEHNGSLGISGLPQETRDRVLRVVMHFQTLAYLASFRVVDEEIILASVRIHIIQAWDALAPFIYQERNREQKVGTFRFFEDLAVAAKLSEQRLEVPWRSLRVMS